MTRETKIGMVVAGSFLTLVGGVLAMKLRQPEALETASGLEAPVEVAGGQSPPPGAEVALPAPLQPLVPAPAQPPAPTAPLLNAPMGQGLPETTTSNNGPTMQSPAQVPAQNVSAPVPPPQPDLSLQNGGSLLTSAPGSNGLALDKKSEDKKPVVEQKAAPQEQAPPPDAMKLADPLNLPVVAAPGAGAPSPVLPTDAVSSPSIGTQVDTTTQPPKPAEAPKPVPIAPAQDGFSAVGGPKPVPPVEQPNTPVIPPPEQPKVETPSMLPPPVTPAPVVNEPPPTPAPKVDEVKPAPVEAPKAGLARLEDATPSMMPAPLPLPNSVSGVQPAGGSRPAPPAPTSDSFLEEEYRTQSGDTFAGLSRRFYFSDRYGPALQQYNREYSLTSANVRREPPILGGGASVWIPPTRILERRYPHLFADAQPAPAKPANSGAPATFNAVPGAKPAPAASATKWYRVRDGGETMQEVARRTQVPNQEWMAIYRLNPSLNPSAVIPIPAGTLLRVPPEAKVE